MIRLIALTLSLFLITPTKHASAQSSSSAEEKTPKIAIIKKDKRAPFDGVLYNNAAYADQKAKHKDEKQR